MAHTEERYINPHTDFGFKRLFGSEFNKELLISFLNALFGGKQNVQEITYMNSEQLGERIDSRRAIFDVYCENDKGEKFIVEMQNVYQDFFKDRTVYYSTFPIREQARRGDEWDFHLNSVYTVGLLNFIFEEDENEDKNVECPWHHEVKLVDIDRNTIFYDKLTYIYEEIPKFNKKENELETMFDKWMYVLRNLSKLMERPAALRERIFTRLFEQAEIARFNALELRQYEDSVNAYRDIVNAIKTAEKKKYAEGHAEGRAEGIAEEKASTARKLLSLNTPIDIIMKVTGLPKEDIENLQV